MALNGGFFTLLAQRRFAPLFFTQFLSAFVDNAFRSALIILVTYHETLASGFNKSLVVTFIGGLVILPFFLFSGLAGQLADRFEKSRLVIIIKTLEISVMALGVYALFTHSLGLLILVLFLTMMQSAFFGPLKYSLLPLYLQEKEIITGNALIESSTFVAILLGSIFGGIAVSLPDYSLYVISSILIVSSLLAWVSSWYLQQTPPADRKLKINPNLYTTTLNIIRTTSHDRTLFLSIIGISWFWVIGGIFLTQISTYGKDIIGGNKHVTTLFLTLFTFGIGIGSFLCTLLSKGKVNLRHIVFGAIGMTLFILDLVIASHFIDLSKPDYIGINQFLFHSTHYLNNWRIIFDLLMIAVCGGLYTVPLYTLLQTESDPRFRSRTIAANNIMNSFFMVISSVVSMVLISLNVTILNIFLLTGILNILVMRRISRLVPESILQLILQGLFKIFFRVEVKGLDNFHQAGKRTLIVANHTSFLDGMLIFAFIPERLNFAIYSQYASKWWLRIMRPHINLFPLDPINPLATKHLIEFLRQNHKCVIFPEGRITVTGSLMKIYDGPGMVADRAEATILPLRIEGAQYSFFSHLRGVVRRKIFPKITLTILPPQVITADPNLKGKERRKIMSNKLYDLMVGMLFETSSYKSTLFESFIESAKVHGMRRVVVEDLNRIPLTYRQLLMRSFTLGHYILERTVPGERVGMMLPTSIPAIVSFLALQSIGRVPTMLNFSLGSQSIVEMCGIARTRLILTSRKFIKLAKLEEAVEKLSQKVQILYLEDIPTQISLIEKIRGAASAFIPYLAYGRNPYPATPEDPAVILFTSGSEGTPKGVALSHSNINANRFQITTMIDFNPQDVVLSVLPIFHSFGLTGGALVPLLEGIRTFYYPTPLHYRMIPATAYDINATIFFATDTFLKRYARLAHPYDFYSIRYVFAGAEKLQQETQSLWFERFGIQVLEAYGTTETAPALSLNTRMHHKSGSVGRFLPAIQRYLKPEEGISLGGRLFVKGPNIMLGYINPETGRVMHINDDPGFDQEGNTHEGWYDTGDIVSIDDLGFITVQGRIKRFAKVGGEMISLVALEGKINTAWPNDHHVVFAFPDTRKGEQIILLTTGTMTRDDIVDHLKRQDISELSFPRKVIFVNQLPQLATGKIDFQAAKKLAESLMPKNE